MHAATLRLVKVFHWFNTVECPGGRNLLGGSFGGFPMLDTATTALLRAVLEEVCEGVSRHETGARTHVASKILEAATKGETSPDSLRQVGHEALSHVAIIARR